MLLDDVVIDPDLAEVYTILRSEGAFVAGGWIDTKETIAAFGVVSMARAKDLTMIPEGDRPSEARAFYSQGQPLYVTHNVPAEGQAGTSDILVWRGTKYRIINVSDYSNRGYWKAIAERILGE